MFEHTSLEYLRGNKRDDLRLDTVNAWIRASESSFWCTFGAVQIVRVALFAGMAFLTYITFSSLPWLGGLFLLIFAAFIYISEVYIRALSVSLRSAKTLNGYSSTKYESQKLEAEILKASLKALSITKPMGDLSGPDHAKIMMQIEGYEQTKKTGDYARQQNPKLQTENRDLKNDLSKAKAQYATLKSSFVEQEDELSKLKSAARKDSKSLALADDKEIYAELESRLEKSASLSTSQVELHALILSHLREDHPAAYSQIDDMSLIPDEILRVRQYDAVIRLYAQKIQDLRKSEMDDDVQEDAIEQMCRLRDREIEILESQGS